MLSLFNYFVAIAQSAAFLSRSSVTITFSVLMVSAFIMNSIMP
ncbi:hypothetical protein PL9631_1020090 [Planktothrix paucivesiculata PCC 9631]|uniref:Uncharacterized protein n=1 Tax=Planktothrix paucivesiculata PCC 9631 TaxID=671071 RepID=A0A7Z9BJC5_9CYAN|nr:hypothetical protein PL9631_1020090 [Planktothrix paucivesiculata PCC 9631]